MELHLESCTIETVHITGVRYIDVVWGCRVAVTTCEIQLICCRINTDTCMCVRFYGKACANKLKLEFENLRDLYLSIPFDVRIAFYSFESVTLRFPFLLSVVAVFFPSLSRSPLVNHKHITEKLCFCFSRSARVLICVRLRRIVIWICELNSLCVQCIAA